MKENIKLPRRVADAFIRYGEQCICCGTKNKAYLRVVSDEIQMGERVNPVHTYAWLQKNHYPDGFITLCYNCCHSWEEFGQCPHANSIYDPAYIRRRKSKDGKIPKAEAARLAEAMLNPEFRERYGKLWVEHKGNTLDAMMQEKEPVSFGKKYKTRFDYLVAQSKKLPDGEYDSIPDIYTRPKKKQVSTSPTYAELKARGFIISDEDLKRDEHYAEMDRNEKNNT